MISIKYKPDFTLVTFLYLIAFCLPTFFVFLGSAGAILVNGLLITSVLSIIIVFPHFFQNMTKQEKDIFQIFLLLFMFFMIHISASLLVGIFFSSHGVIIRDTFELHRPILYLFSFMVGFFFVKTLDDIKKLDKLLMLIFIIIVTFGFIHFFHISDFFSSLYIKYSNLRSSRITVPFNNPYDYAFMMSFFVVYFFLKGLFNKSRYFLAAFLAIVMMILTQSRSVAAGFIISFFFVMPVVLLFIGVNIKKATVSKSFLKYFVFFVCVFELFLYSIPFLIDNFSYLTTQFIRFLQEGEIGNSANLRLNQMIYTYNKASNPFIFLFGNGPAKAEMENVESIYTYQFFRYGFIGLALYMILPIIISIFFSYKTIKKLKQSSIYFLYTTYLVWLQCIPLLSIGNNFTEQVRISFFFYSSLGVLAKSYILTRKL